MRTFLFICLVIASSLAKSTSTLAEDLQRPLLIDRDANYSAQRFCAVPVPMGGNPSPCVAALDPGLLAIGGQTTNDLKDEVFLLNGLDQAELVWTPGLGNQAQLFGLDRDNQGAFAFGRYRSTSDVNWEQVILTFSDDGSVVDEIYPQRLWDQVSRAANGDWLVTGNYDDDASQVARLDKNGAERWAFDLSGFASGWSRMPHLAFDDDGSTVVVYQHFTGDGWDTRVIKLSSSGSVVWRVAFGEWSLSGYSQISDFCGLDCWPTDTKVLDSGELLLGLIDFVTPYQDHDKSAGLFAIRLSDGSLSWSNENHGRFHRMDFAAARFFQTSSGKPGLFANRTRVTDQDTSELAGFVSITFNAAGLVHELREAIAPPGNAGTPEPPESSSGAVRRNEKLVDMVVKNHTLHILTDYPGSPLRSASHLLRRFSLESEQPFSVDRYSAPTSGHQPPLRLFYTGGNAFTVFGLSSIDENFGGGSARVRRFVEDIIFDDTFELQGGSP